ncbi:MAG TPA: hypothetical protein VGQ86_01925 [Candidatus Limnocylindria bacterium]|nr:hypothetical protein [Candidatus Limnocylindria bacterium]
MLAKLLAYLAHAKGASIAIVVTVSAATAAVGAATPEVQDAVRDVAAAVGIDIHGANALRGCDDQTGQPAVVAQRNAADKLLRAAYEADHKALIDLRGGKDQDNKLVGDVVRNYDDQLRDALNKSLADVAALTLGREGQVRKAESASPAAVVGGATPATAVGTTTACPATDTTAASSPTPSKSPKPSGSPEQGRVAVADRTTLNDALQAIVDKTTEDMKMLVEKATDEVTKLSAPEVKGGKPSAKPTP